MLNCSGRANRHCSLRVPFAATSHTNEPTLLGNPCLRAPHSYSLNYCTQVLRFEAFQPRAYNDARRSDVQPGLIVNRRRVAVFRADIAACGLADQRLLEPPRAGHPASLAYSSRSPVGGIQSLRAKAQGQCASGRACRPDSAVLRHQGHRASTATRRCSSPSPGRGSGPGRGLTAAKQSWASHDGIHELLRAAGAVVGPVC
jgi:hypothetical protein